MLELLLSPRKAERRAWEMFFVGAFYAALSVLLVSWFFGKDIVMARYLGVLIVTFTVMFSIPFVYFLFKMEAKKELRYDGAFRILKEHKNALTALMWLFLGFLVGYSIMYMVLPRQNFAAQIETYCSINRPSNFEGCLTQYGVNINKITGFTSSTDKFLGIFSNNIYVLIFTVVFSLIFGAGAIFILAWNASVIAAAVGIYTKSQLGLLPLGLGRYMIHGIPEIAAYLFGALAGGILSISLIRGEYKSSKFWDIMQDVINLLIIAIIILVFAGLLEVYITPMLF